MGRNLAAYRVKKKLPDSVTPGLMNHPQRYSNLPFPAYRFVPGRAPHPTRDPDGHSYGKQPELLPAFQAEEWRNCIPYLYGIDLFNHEYWWEAHESLEAVWVAAGRDSQTGQFLQGLIQIAVAHLKQHQGFTDVARRMAKTGIEKIEPVGASYMGIDVNRLRTDVQNFMENKSHPHVLIVLDQD